MLHPSKRDYTLYVEQTPGLDFSGYVHPFALFHSWSEYL
jgi:hypothetical protein